MKIHRMRLKPTPFAMIASGEKTIESRLYDDKRQSIDLGDTIYFHAIDDETKEIKVKVLGLLRYKTFGDMFAHNDPSKFGGDDGSLLTEQLLTYYSQADQDKYGVLGIEISLIK